MGREGISGNERRNRKRRMNESHALIASTKNLDRFIMESENE